MNRTRPRWSLSALVLAMTAVLVSAFAAPVHAAGPDPVDCQPSTRVTIPSNFVTDACDDARGFVLLLNRGSFPETVNTSGDAHRTTVQGIVGGVGDLTEGKIATLIPGFKKDNMLLPGFSMKINLGNGKGAVDISYDTTAVDEYGFAVILAANAPSISALPGVAATWIQEVDGYYVQLTRCRNDNPGFFGATQCGLSFIWNINFADTRAVVNGALSLVEFKQIATDILNGSKFVKYAGQIGVLAKSLVQGGKAGIKISNMATESDEIATATKHLDIPAVATPVTKPTPALPGPVVTRPNVPVPAPVTQAPVVPAPVTTTQAPVVPAPTAGSAETTGGITHTWTNPANAGGQEGPTIASHQTVQVSCRTQGFKVPDGDTWWYRITQAPWSDTYFASSDAFYNNGQTSGSLANGVYVDTAVPTCDPSTVPAPVTQAPVVPAPVTTTQAPVVPAPTAGSAETTGGITHTWTNPANAGGQEGPTIASHQTVQVSCRTQGFKVPDGDTWWYRITQAPWSDTYFASSDAFYNNGQTSGSLANGVYVDTAVPTC